MFRSFEHKKTQSLYYVDMVDMSKFMFLFRVDCYDFRNNSLELLKIKIILGEVLFILVPQDTSIFCVFFLLIYFFISLFIFVSA